LSAERNENCLFLNARITLLAFRLLYITHALLAHYRCHCYYCYYSVSYPSYYSYYYLYYYLYIVALPRPLSFIIIFYGTAENIWKFQISKEHDDAPVKGKMPRMTSSLEESSQRRRSFPAAAGIRIFVCKRDAFLAWKMENASE